MFTTDSGLFYYADRELLQPIVYRLARPKTMATTGRLDARWQWVAGTKLVAQSAKRDPQQVCYFVIGVIGSAAFGHARHSAVLFGVMVGTMKTKTSRNDHIKSHRSLLVFA